MKTTLNTSNCALSINELSQQKKQPILVLTRNIHDAERLHQEIAFFNNTDIPVQLFPDWETLPYDHFSPHQDIISERLSLLAKLPQIQQGIFLASATTLMHRLPPQDYLLAHSLLITRGEHIEMTQLRDQLITLGYRHVEQVMEHGELSIRGAILDLFPMGSHRPFRIEFFDNEVDNIRQFDPENQRSMTKIEKIALLPAHEFPLNEAGIGTFRQSWRERFSGNPTESTLYRQISNGEAATGIEYYLPLFFDKMACFFDYLPSNTLCVVNDIQTSVANFWDEITLRYEQFKHDNTRPLCAPNDIFLPQNQLNHSLKSFTQIELIQHHYKIDVTVNHREQQPFAKLQHYLNNYNGRILFTAESTGRRETLIDLLKTIDINPKSYTSWQAFNDDQQRIGISVAPLEHGGELTEYQVSIITETQLFGQPLKQQQQQRKRHQVDPNLLIRNLTELTLGAPVVHINHGVGRYLGLETLTTGAITAEYLTLEYADQDKIYVPVNALQLISRYSGADKEHAPLQKLGNKQWEKIKRKTAEQIRDTAAELLDIYGKRMASKGHAFTLNKIEYQKFADGFAFDETPDQLKAIQDLIQDMTTTRCMDRLICGDVGFGKTEVAMRAAFIATINHKQAAILVPTTLLATQHLKNFKDRFSDWPINVAGLSRMETAQQQKKTIAGLAAGTVDIVIGTHKLLSQQVKFKDLGLLIVDEEQRFGVRQKERIASLRAKVDMLTLTATPIPRTLNMAMAGTRDLSLIASPPARRLSVKTFVHEENNTLIREAVLREIMRGGQLYFLHNEVATINAEAAKLQTLIPEARIAIAHGQLSERELEQVMADFYHQRFNVLLCSTIIESGIDIPSANTIIINRADRFGLSQLHQLRGRVGRSHHQAYAYLLTPNEKAMTKDAIKRLDAIAQLGDLGIGFSLATHDLEIRGAGELLGDEQSGHMHEIGFTLYMELLEEAVTAIKEGREPQLESPEYSNTEVELGVSTLLPKDYVGDVNIRLTLYKRLANCKNHQEIQEFKTELIDRFGLLPEAAQNLLSATAIRLEAQALGITKIDIASKFGYVHFNEKPNIKLEKLISLIQQQAKTYQMQGSQKLRFVIDTAGVVQQLQKLLTLLK